jgi:hypothetical protein
MTQFHGRGPLPSLLRLAWPLLALSLAWGGCVKLDNRGFDGAKLKEDASRSPAVDIGAYTDFAWDRLWIFPPQIPGSAIKAAVGVSVPFPHRELESHCLLVFFAGPKLSAAFEESRSEVDFVDVARPGGFSRPEARFRGTLQSGGTVLLSKL